MFDKALLALPGARRALGLTCVLTLLRSLAVVGQAFALARFVVDVWSGLPLSGELAWLALFLVCFAARQLIGAAVDAHLERFAGACAHDLRVRALKAVFAAGPLFVSERGSGAVVADVIEGVSDVETYAALLIPKICAVVIVPLVVLAVVFPLDWVSGVIAAVCFPFIILYMVMIGHTASDEAARRHEQFERMSSHFIDSVRGMSTLKAFGLARSHGERIFAVSERFREATMKTLRIATLSSAVLDAFATLALAAVAIMLGFRLVDGSLSFFPALAVLILVPEYFRPIREFAADYHATLDGKTALRSLLDLIEQGEAEAGAGARAADAEAGADAADAGAAGAGVVCGCAEADAGAAEAEAGTRACARAAGARAEASVCDGRAAGACIADPIDDASDGAVPSLTFSDVGFSYPDFDGALQGVSFSVEGPCKVAVIGPSGSGKSTLVKLLGGFADPSCGHVCASGESASTLRERGWQQRVAFIPQDPYVFHASVRDNVAFYRPEASCADVERALEFVGLSAVVDSLDEGVHTRIGAGARELSGGQAQRIALARAFLDPQRSVLLFDEPTAHLDIETELELKARMLELMAGRLAFIATHRLHWVRDVDYVLEMDGGRVVWQGTPNQWYARQTSQDVCSTKGAENTQPGNVARKARDVWRACVEGDIQSVRDTLLEQGMYAAHAVKDAESVRHGRASASSVCGAQVSSAVLSTPPVGHDSAQAACDLKNTETVTGRPDVQSAHAASSLDGVDNVHGAGCNVSRVRGMMARAVRLWRSDSWVRPHFAQHTRVLVFALALSVLAFCFAGALMFTSGYMISLAAALPLTVLALHVPSLFVRIFGIGKPVLQYLERLASHDWVLRMTSELRRRLFVSLERATSPLVRSRRVGEVLGTLTDDIGHIQNLYLRTVLPLASAWLIYVLIVVLMGAFSPLMAVFLALALGICVLVAPAVSAYVGGVRSARAGALRARFYDELSDNVLGVADWMFSGRVGECLARAEVLERAVREQDLAARRFARWRDVAVHVVFGICVVAILVWASVAFAPDVSVTGATAALAGAGSENAPAYPPNWIAAFALCFFPLIEALLPAGAAGAWLVDHGQAVARLNSYPDPDAASGLGQTGQSACEKQSERERRSDRTEQANRDAQAARESRLAHDAQSAHGALPAQDTLPAHGVPPIRADIELDHVSFGYPDTSPLIRDVTLSIPQGTRLAVLGRSGAGKSTLAALVRGEIAPQKGSVSVAGRVAVSWGDDMACMVGIIEQKPHLFNQTLRENLLVGRVDAADAELERVLDDVGLTPLLNRLSCGLDTVVDEAGLRFSGGERHRIALARVLLARVPVVVLDEPFAGLDPATERALVEVMFKTLGGRTIIMITHHLQGVSLCDRVVLLEDGVFALDGAPADLARTSDRYRRLLALDAG